jgi:uncharacterized protein DUF2794
MSFGETDPSQLHRGDGTAAAAPSPCVTFDRRELDRIFGLYGRMVAAGEWRDYAIDFLRDRAVFSVFRHAAEVPLFPPLSPPFPPAPVSRCFAVPPRFRSTASRRIRSWRAARALTASSPRPA